MKTILDAVHPYAITRTADGRYTTRVSDPMKPDGRRMIRRKSLTALYDYLITFYGVESPEAEMSFESLFNEWIEYKRQFINATNRKRSLSPSTIRRYERDYDRYIKGSSLPDKALKDLTTPRLTSMLIAIIKDGDMTERCAGNVIGYVREALSYAFRSEYLIKDVGATLDRALLLSQCRYTPPKTDEERILSLDEFRRLYEAIRTHEEQHPTYLPDYGVELAMLTGMRVSEIAALTWESVDDEYVHIDQAERRLDYVDKPSEIIIGEPKNGKHRAIPKTDDIRELLGRIFMVGHTKKEGFIFVNEKGERCSARAIGLAALKRGREVGIQNVSIHRIRRTVSSILNTLLPTTAVAAMLGHTEQVNESHYDYDITAKNAKVSALEKVSPKVTIFEDFVDAKKEAKNA